MIIKRRKSTITLLLALVYLAMSSPTIAQIKDKTTTIVDHYHHSISNNIVNLAKNIDTYFYEQVENQHDLKNHSYISLENSSVFKKGGDYDDKFRIRGKLDLPNTRRHLKIVFDSDDDNEDLDESVLTSKENDNDDGSNLGIESTKTLFQQWKRRFRIGVRLNSKPDTYVKLSFSRKDKLGSTWQATSRQDIRYSHQDSWRSGFNVGFVNPISEHSNLRLSTKVYYQNTNDYFELAQIVSVFTSLDSKQSIEYRVGVLGTSGRSPETTDYFVGTNYRRSFYRPWLFLSVKPEFVFSKENNYKLSPSLTLTLQAIFSKNSATE